MKTRISKKQIIDWYGKENVIYLGYCEMQTILNILNPRYYCAGVYGWNCDIYIIGENVITTGYNPFGSVRPSLKTIKKYNEKADKLRKNKSIKKYETRYNRAYKLIEQFIEEAKQCK